MSRRGRIFTYSIVYSGTDAFKDRAPYVIALVEEAEGKRLAFVEGYTEQMEIGIGTEVEFLEDEKGNSICRFMSGASRAG